MLSTCVVSRFYSLPFRTLLRGVLFRFRFSETGGRAWMKEAGQALPNVEIVCIYRWDLWL